MILYFILVAFVVIYVVGFYLCAVAKKRSRMIIKEEQPVVMIRCSVCKLFCDSRNIFPMKLWWEKEERPCCIACSQWFDENDFEIGPFTGVAERKNSLPEELSAATVH